MLGVFINSTNLGTMNTRINFFWKFFCFTTRYKMKSICFFEVNTFFWLLLKTVVSFAWLDAMSELHWLWFQFHEKKKYDQFIIHITEQLKILSHHRLCYPKKVVIIALYVYIRGFGMKWCPSVLQLSIRNVQFQLCK